MSFFLLTFLVYFAKSVVNFFFCSLFFFQFWSLVLKKLLGLLTLAYPKSKNVSMTWFCTEKTRGTLKIAPKSIVFPAKNIWTRKIFAICRLMKFYTLFIYFVLLLTQFYVDVFVAILLNFPLSNLWEFFFSLSCIICF